MTILFFFDLFTAAVAIGTAIYIMYAFRSLRNEQLEEFGILERRIGQFELDKSRLIEDLQVELAALRSKHEALPCWEKGKSEEKTTSDTSTDDDVPRRTVHVVSVMNGGSLGEMLGQLFGGNEPPEVKAARYLFSVVESDKKTATQLVDAMKKITDNEVLDIALQGLIQREDYEYVQLVKNEIEKRKTSK